MVSHDIQLLAPKPTKIQDTRVKWTSHDWSCLVYVGSEVMFFIYGIGMFLIEKRNCKPVLTLFKATHAKNGICKCISRGCSKLLASTSEQLLIWPSLGKPFHTKQPDYFILRMIISLLCEPFGNSSLDHLRFVCAIWHNSADDCIFGGNGHP